MWFDDRWLESFAGLSLNEFRKIESLIIRFTGESDPNDRRRFESIREVNGHDLMFEE